MLGGLVWWTVRFPAEEEEFGEAPFVLRYQDGVPGAEVELVQAGLTGMEDYLRTDVGRGAVEGTVQVRLSWSQGCRPLLGPDSVSTAWADGSDFLCLNAAHPSWRWLVERDASYPAFVAAHEHVHNWQAELGCFVDSGEHEWQWLFEGMANELAYRALVKSGSVPPREAEEAIWAFGGLASDNGTLRDYEQESDGAGNAYGLFQLGAREAARSAGTPASFGEFCLAVAGGQPWREAFADSFELSTDELYERVETLRARERSTTDQPPLSAGPGE